MFNDFNDQMRLIQTVYDVGGRYHLIVTRTGPNQGSVTMTCLGCDAAVMLPLADEEATPLFCTGRLPETIVERLVEWATSHGKDAQWPPSQPH